MIRGIIFDCFGVLYGGSLESLEHMCPPERLQELRDINKQSDYGYISGDEYTAAFSEIIGVSVEAGREVLRKRHNRNSELVEFARSLRGDYRVGMLSNVSSGTIQRLFTEQELAETFDATLFSYEVHVLKPHPEAFDMIAERLGLLPEECVMIDDLESNCDGARRAGMLAIRHINNDTTRQQLAHLLREVQ